MQAKREGDDSEALAGLVPSKLFWETREQVRQTILTETESAASRHEGTTLCCAAGSVSRNSNNKRNRSRSSRSGTVTGKMRRLFCKHGILCDVDKFYFNASQLRPQFDFL